VFLVTLSPFVFLSKRFDNKGSGIKGDLKNTSFFSLKCLMFVVIKIPSGMIHFCKISFPDQRYVYKMMEVLSIVIRKSGPSNKKCLGL
jgi:hypothetical protein